MGSGAYGPSGSRAEPWPSFPLTLCSPPMRYLSTRGQAPVRDFAGVLLAGLAEDGGLYVPATWPQFSHADLRAMRGLTYAELAARIMHPFIGTALPFATLQTLC